MKWIYVEVKRFEFYKITLMPPFTLKTPDIDDKLYVHSTYKELEDRLGALQGDMSVSYRHQLKTLEIGKWIKAFFLPVAYGPREGKNIHNLMLFVLCWKHTQSK